MTKKEMVMAAIEDLGYKPQLDEDGDVVVRYQMKKIYFLTDSNEESYLTAILPQFIEVQEGEEMQTLVVCNKLTREIKLAKVYIDQTFKNVTASCEFFYTDEESLRLCVERTLDILGIVRSAFYSAKAELTE